MLIDEFLEPNVLIVSGKGGTGKTTVAAALALMAARRGLKVCVAEIDGKGSLARLFDFEDDLGYDPHEISPGVWGINIRPEDALTEYLEVQYHMRRLSRALTSTHFVDYVATAAPGLKDILMLGKVWYLEQGRAAGEAQHRFDTIVVDAPAAGHVLTFLSAPMGLSDALRMGPLRRQSDWLVQMLRDPRRTRVHLVTLPEEMPVSETLEATHALAERVGIAQGAVIANAVYGDVFSPAEEKTLGGMSKTRRNNLISRAAKEGIVLDDEDLDALLGYARFVSARRAIQKGHLDELRSGLNHDIVELPFIFSAGLALPDIETLADSIEEKIQKL